MSNAIRNETFATVLFELLDETFREVHGNYLDPGTSLFETLKSIPAAVASQPVSASCASLAAQIDHVRYYIDVLEQYILGTPPTDVDWNRSWTEIGSVSEAGWSQLKVNLELSYERLLETAHGINDWETDDRVAGALNILVHSAYHLGEIRQALCTLVG